MSYPLWKLLIKQKSRKFNYSLMILTTTNIGSKCIATPTTIRIVNTNDEDTLKL